MTTEYDTSSSHSEEVIGMTRVSRELSACVLLHQCWAASSTCTSEDGFDAATDTPPLQCLADWRGLDCALLLQHGPREARTCAHSPQGQTPWFETEARRLRTHPVMCADVTCRGASPGRQRFANASAAYGAQQGSLPCTLPHGFHVLLVQLVHSGRPWDGC